ARMGGATAHLDRGQSLSSRRSVGAQRHTTGIAVSLIRQCMSRNSCSTFSGHALEGGGLHLAPARVKYPLRVAIWLRAPLEDQIRRRLKSEAIEARRHRPVERIASILPVDDGCHPLQRFHHLLGRNNLMVKPIGDMLA